MFGLGFIIGPALGGLLSAVDLRLPFVAAGALSLLNLAYGCFVLPESLPPERRRPFTWKAVNPVASLRALARLEGVGLIVAVIACAGLAQGVLYNVWVLYTSFKFGWSAQDNGWSLAAVGVVSVVVQGGLLRLLLKRVAPRPLAVMGLLSSTLAYAAWGAASAGWVMYAVIFTNLLGYTVTASLQSIVSGAAGADEQGRTLGSVSAIISLTAVIAPLLTGPILMSVSHLPPGDWRIGAPMFFGAALQAAALLLAWLHFRSHSAR